MLFQRVLDAEDRADKLKSTGKDDSEDRHLFKKEAKLADREEMLLKKAAKDADKDLKIFEKQAVQSIKELKRRYPAAATFPEWAKAQAREVDRQQQQLVLNQVTTLKASMSAARFQQFQNYVIGRVGPSIHYRPLPPPGVKLPAPPPGTLLPPPPSAAPRN
jgi:hypothetical protein